MSLLKKMDLQIQGKYAVQGTTQVEIHELSITTTVSSGKLNTKMNLLFSAKRLMMCKR